MNKLIVLLLVGIVCISIAVSCSLEKNNTEDEVSDVDANGEVVDLNNLKADSIPIFYTKAPLPFPLEVIKETGITIVEEIQLGEHKVTLFKRDEDDKTLVFAGYKLNDQMYLIGQAGYDGMTSEISAVSLSLFEIPMIKVIGACGAACHLTHYIFVDGETPVRFLTVWAQATEQDLNFDGNLEIIASGGTPSTTEIYLLDQHRELIMTSINEVLQAISVRILPDRTIEVYFKGFQQPKVYHLIDQELTEIN